MFKWIVENRQWLFSGIGITAALGLIKLFIWARSQKPRTLAETPALAARQSASLGTGPKPTTPTGNEIAITVDDSPPFQREQIGKNYIGLMISWPIIFYSLTRLPNGRYIVGLAYGAETWGAKITVNVNIDDYPRLKTAPTPSSDDKNKPLVHGWIEGEIVRCGFGGMEIKPNKLEFFD